MPGAWEIEEANSVVVGILHTDVTTIAWSFGLRNLIIPGKEHLRKWDPFVPLAGMPYDHARNVAVMHCLQRNAQWMFFYDSDVIPPRDTILRLIARGKPLISGIYCRRSPPHGLPVMMKNGQWVTDYPPNAVIEVDVVGAGCLLIHRSVFERMTPQRPGKPWFDWRVDMMGLLPPGECLSEDYTFNYAVKRQLGIPTLVDTSILCRHVGYAEATYGKLEPLNTIPVT